MNDGDSLLGSIPFERAGAPSTKALALAYVMFERRDSEAQCAFLEDFGLTRVGGGFFRGASDKPLIYEVASGDRDRYIGMALEMASMEDLEILARLEGGTIVDNPRPGGGKLLSLTDPAGWTVHAVWGQTPVTSLEDRPSFPVNQPLARNRINRGVRLPAGPPLVQRTGHLVLTAVNFQEVSAWYRQRFGFLPTDVLCLPDGTPAGSFMRLDRGETPVDHHTLVIAQDVANNFGHVAFEVLDADAIGMGAEHLKARSYTHAWGVGRHLLGSQVFDYWRDPTGDRHEHYSDSDVFDAAYEPGYHPLNAAGLYQWGPDFPKDFEDVGFSLSKLLGLLKTLSGDNELTLSKVKGLMGAMKAPARPWLK